MGPPNMGMGNTNGLWYSDLASGQATWMDRTRGTGNDPGDFSNRIVQHRFQLAYDQQNKVPINFQEYSPQRSEMVIPPNQSQPNQPSQPNMMGGTGTGYYDVQQCYAPVSNPNLRYRQMPPDICTMQSLR